jgi:hypothetical protein
MRLEFRHLTRYLAVMVVLVAAFGMILRLATRCDLRTLTSLNLPHIVSCAMLRAEDAKR